MKINASMTFTGNAQVVSGKRDALRQETGETVTHSVPGLMEPTFSLRVGRKPDARLFHRARSCALCISLKVGGVWGRAPRLLLVLQRWTRRALIALSPCFNSSMNGKGSSMQKRLCSECGETADVSLCQIVSSVGRAPRQQRCSVSTAFCAACLQGRIKLLRRLGLHGIQKPLSPERRQLRYSRLQCQGRVH